MHKNIYWSMFQKKFWVDSKKLTLQEVENIAFWNGNIETKLKELRNDTNQQIDNAIKENPLLSS